MKAKINDRGQLEKNFNAELLSVADEVRYFNNENKTEFRPATIKFTDDYGKEQIVSAILYEKSWKHGMEIGKKYMATVRKADGEIYVSISHLTEIGERASVDMFDFNVDEVEQETVKEKPLEEKLS